MSQGYRESREVKIKPFSYKNDTITLHLPTQKLNCNKQIRTLMPNLIHSLDAASLALLVYYYFNYDTSKKENNFYSIHDCFAVTANNVENLIKYLKIVYRIIYTQNEYLKDFDKQLKNYIKHTYPKQFDSSTLTIKIREKDKDKTYKFPDINKVFGDELPNKLDFEESKYPIS